MHNLTTCSDEEFVEQVYQQLLFRAPDPDGRRVMLEALAAGAPRMDCVDMVLRSAEHAAMRAALRFAPPGHFYSPHPSGAQVEAHARFDWDPASLPGIDLREAQQVQLAKALAAHYPAVPFADKPTPQARYGYDNTAYSYGDAIVLFTMIQHLRPKRIIEVGSGHSSCAILDSVDRLAARAEVTFVEPYAALVKSLLRPGDLETHRLLEQGLQSCPLAMFASLEANDILFIDSSHVSKLGSDVNYLVFEILPALQPGVFVHIHDIPFPFEYGLDWLREGRAWNEAYLLRAFLQFNAAWQIEFFSTMMMRRHTAWFAEHMPVVLKNIGAHIWLSRST